MKNISLSIIILMFSFVQASANQVDSIGPIDAQPSETRLINYQAICSYLSKTYTRSYGQTVFSVSACMNGEKTYFGTRRGLSHVQIQIPLYYNQDRSIIISMKIDTSKRGVSQASDFKVITGLGGE